MILDSHGNQLRRTIGFLGGFVRVCKAQVPTVELSLVGSETITLEEDEEEDAARTLERMRRSLTTSSSLLARTSFSLSVRSSLP
jgi:hypothetical protein